MTAIEPMVLDSGSRSPSFFSSTIDFRATSRAASRCSRLKITRRALKLRPDDGALQRELIQRLIGEERDEEAALQLEQYVAWLRERGDPIAAYRAARPLLAELDEFEESFLLCSELGIRARVALYFPHMKARAILEELLLDVMFELPEIEDGTIFRVTAASVDGKEQVRRIAKRRKTGS